MAEKKINQIKDDQTVLAMASAKSIKVSPQKVNLVLGLIRGLDAEQALNVLEFSNKRISGDIKKILKSAISNAENNHQLDIDKLVVHEALVGKSMVMKRFRPRARGRSGKILKPSSKIKIILKEQQQPKEKKITEDTKNKVEADNKNKFGNNKNENKVDNDTKKLKGKDDGSKS